MEALTSAIELRTYYLALTDTGLLAVAVLLLGLIYLRLGRKS
jgi:hypothetical protein